MGLAHSPRIVTDGLVLALDAANPKSYPGSGSIWYDISGNNFHMSLKNSPSYNAALKCFEPNGVDQYGSCDGTVAGSAIATASNLGIDGSKQKTVVAIFQVREIGSISQGFFDVGLHGTIGEHYALRLGGSYTNFRAQFWSTPDYDFSFDGRSNFNFYSVIYPEDQIGRTYVNTSLVGQDASPYTLNINDGRPFEMARLYGSTFGTARTQMFMIYNKALTSQEIEQNFNALRGRFGL